MPTLGGVYTIRDIFDGRIYGHDEPALLLVEIVNPVREYVSHLGRRVTCEPFWLSFRFRPVRATSIDIFTKLLEPVPGREPADRVASIYIPSRPCQRSQTVVR